MSADAPQRGFVAQEFENRLSRLQDGMRTRNIDLAFFTTEAEFRYFTGFFTQFWQSPTRPWFLLAPQSGKPVAVIPEIGVECMRRAGVEDIRAWDSPAADDGGIELLCETIVELAGEGASVGLLKGRETALRMPLADFEALKQRLSGLQFEDITGLVLKLRMVKSEAEIEKIAHACRSAGRAFDRAPDAIHAGMSEREAFRAFKILCLEEGVDDVSYLVGGAGAGGYRDIISPPSERKLAAGDVLMFDTGCVWDGYFCDFDRNFAIGEVAGAVQDAHARLWEATEAGLEASRPGACCSDLFHAMAAHLPGAISGGVGRMGHGLGMQLTEFPSITPFDRTELEHGMVMTLEPSIDLGGGRMLVHEENLLVRDDGPLLLTRRTPQRMPVIG
mgnify:CR=1 FL=1